MTVRILRRRGLELPLSTPSLRGRANEMMRELGVEGAELSVLLTGDVEMRELNRQFRHKDKPTDVLAFAMAEGERSPDERLLGDVVISIDTARTQAERRGKGLVEEVMMLLAHGLLHLLGWDHDTLEKDRAMRRRTADLCAVASRKNRKFG